MVAAFPPGAQDVVVRVAAFPPGAQDVVVSGVGKIFLLLSHKFSWFVCFAGILRSLLF